MTVWQPQLGCHIAFVCALISWSPAVAQTVANKPTNDARSVYVVREYLPSATIESNPARVQGYTPTERDEFESKLKAIQRFSSDDVVGEASLVSGIFYANYRDGQLVDGRAGLEVVNKHDADGILSLAPCRLPIRQLRWENPDGATVTAGTGSTGSFMVFVDRSSRLLFSWTLRGDPLPEATDSRPATSGLRASFSIALPPSSMSQLVLDLPTGLRPEVDAGEARLINNDGFADYEVVPDKAGDGLERWLVTLGGTHTCTLRLFDRAANTEFVSRTRVRQATTYRLSESAIEVQAEISLTFSDSELPELVLETDPHLRVTGVRIGEHQLVPDQITRGSRPGRVILSFDTPLTGASRKLVVTALSPLVVNQPIHLPVLRPLDLAWEHATASLEVPDTLLLKRLVCKDAIETNVELNSTNNGGEVHHFQFYRPEATCEVVIGRPSTKAVVTSGTAIVVSQTTLTAQIVANVQSTQGEVFLLDALMASPWKVDSVESTPTDALDGTPARRTRGQQIRMQFRQPVSSDESVRILIKAHRSMPPAWTELSAEDFRIIDFLNVATHRRLVSLRAEAPYHLMVTGNVLPNANTDGLSEADRELLGPITSPLEYVDNGTNDGFRVSLTQEKPRYSGAISVEAMADSEVLRQAIRIRCQPESSPVSSLLVRLSPASDIPFTWSTDEPGGVRSARLVKPSVTEPSVTEPSVTEPSVTESSATEPPATETTATWEIHLRQSRTSPFDLTAVCSSPLVDTTPVFLATLEGAVNQTGTVTVGAIDGTTLSVDASGLTSVPIVRPPDDEYTFQRAAYRYDATRDPAVTVTRQVGPKQSPLAWAWASELTSRFEANGVTSHQIRFKIQNSGRPQTEIALPSTATVHRVIVDDTEVSYARSPGGNPRITVQLPPKKRYPSVRVDYLTYGKALHDFRSANVVWPQIDMECLNRTWDIWLPPGMRAHQDSRFVHVGVTPALRWQERLFGNSILQREKRPFNLFSLADWQSIGQTASREATRNANRFVNALTNVVDANVTPDTASEQLTWGQVLARYEELRGTTSSTAGLSVPKIDVNALRNENVNVNTKYLVGARSVANNLALRNLAIVAGPDSILLTSVSRLGDFDHKPRPTRYPSVFVTKHLRDGLATAFHAVSADTWLSDATVRSEPWSHAVIENDEAFGVGWRHYRVRPNNASTIVGFSVYRPAVFRALGWGLAFITISGAVWFSSRRVWTVFLFVVAIILTLLIPVQFIAVTRGLMVGSLAGLLLTIVRRKTIRSPAPTPIAPGNVATVVRTTMLLMIVLGAWQVFAEDDATLPVPDAIQIYRVIIPVDEDQKPVGDYVFVPNQLFHSLRASTTSQIASMSWLLRSAAYETSLAPRGEAQGLVEAEVTADFELETFQMDAAIAFPLGRDTVRILKNMKLDGQIIEPVWNASGDAIDLQVSRPGRHRLELAIRPVLRNDTASSGFALRIPEFAGAKLRIVPSTRIAGIELPSTIGAVDRSESMGTIDADLGPAGELAVRWPLNSESSADRLPLTADERFWLRIQPSSIVLEGQFSFSVPSGGIEQVELIVDPRLKLSQLNPSHPANYEMESGSVPKIVVRFDESDNNQAFVHATFLLTDTSGLGNVFLPRLSAVADVKGDSTLALSVAPDLDAELVTDPPLQAILPAEFLADWKDATDAPQLAYRLAETTNPWHVASRPRSVQPGTQQLSNWSIGWTHANLNYSADVDPGGQECFQQRVLVPPAIVVNSLQVFRGTEAQPVRWSQAEAILTVFFEQGIRDRYRLIINGKATPSPDERNVLPLVSMLDVAFQSNRLVVRRRSDVLVQDVKTIGLVDESSDVLANVQGDQEEGRIIKSYVIPSAAEDQPEAQFSFLTKRNVPRIRGEIVSQLSFERDNRWFTETLITLDVVGVIDELRLGLPAGWNGPLEMTPEINHEISGKNSDRVLVFRPANPIRDAFRLKIRCETQRAAVALSEASLVKILNDCQVDQYLVLPDRQGEEVISWETSGLQQTQNLLPQDFPLSNEDSTAYRVDRSRVTAVVHNVGGFGGTPRVQLADNHVTWNSDRTCFGVSAFDVTPLQMTECLLDVPPRLQITHISVAGVPVTWRSESDNRVWIPLGPEQLPQRIDIVFSGRLGSSGMVPGERIEAPFLADLPVEQTLWTIQGPSGATFNDALLTHTRTSEVEQARIRADSATLALQLAESLTLPLPEVGLESWTRTWERRRDQAMRIAEGAKDARSTTENDIFEAALRDLQETENDRESPIRFAVQGGSSSVNIQFSRYKASDLGLRAAISVAVACLGLMLVFVMRKFRFKELIEQSWYALGIAVSVVYWLWFTPSFLGLLAMGLCLAAALWPVRKSRIATRSSE